MRRRERGGHGETEAERISGLVAQASHLVRGERAVLEAVVLQDLVVAEVEGALHVLDARLGGVVHTESATRLAAHEVRDEGPGIVALARVAVGHHLVVALHKDDPVAVQVVLVLQKHLARPALPLGGQQVDERALVVRLERRSPRQRRREQLPCVGTHVALGTHARPDVQQIQRPLAVAEQEAARVEPHPASLLVHHVVVAVQHHVDVAVLVHGEVEEHVGEHGIRVHPPDPLDLRVREHELAQEGQLGPEPGHLVVQVGQIVEDVDVVQPAVVHFVLEALEQQVVAHGIVAGLGLGPRDEQDPMVSSAVGLQGGMLLQPQRALLVPVANTRAQRIGGCSAGWICVRVQLAALLLEQAFVGDGEDTARHHVQILDNVILGGSGREGGASSEGPPQDQHGDKATEDGDAQIAHGLVQASAFGKGPFGMRRRWRFRWRVHGASPCGRRLLGVVSRHGELGFGDTSLVQSAKP